MKSFKLIFSVDIVYTVVKILNGVRAMNARGPSVDTSDTNSA